MNRMTISGLFLLIISGTFLIACQSNNKSQKDSESTVQEEKTVVAAPESEEFPFIVAKHYFVNNKQEEISNPKITTEAEFSQLFGAAATMGEGGLPTEIDFTKQYVIAVVKPKTDFTTNLTPVSLIKNEKGEVVFSYAIEQGEKQTFSSIPCLLIIVDKEIDGDVILKEII